MNRAGVRGKTPLRGHGLMRGRYTRPYVPPSGTKSSSALPRLWRQVSVVSCQLSEKAFTTEDTERTENVVPHISQNQGYVGHGICGPPASEELRVATTPARRKGLDGREVPLLPRGEKCFLLTSPLQELGWQLLSNQQADVAKFLAPVTPPRARSDALIEPGPMVEVDLSKPH